MANLLGIWAVEVFDRSAHGAPADQRYESCPIQHPKVIRHIRDRAFALLRRSFWAKRSRTGIHHPENLTADMVRQCLDHYLNICIVCLGLWLRHSLLLLLLLFFLFAICQLSPNTTRDPLGT